MIKKSKNKFKYQLKIGKKQSKHKKFASNSLNGQKYMLIYFCLNFYLFVDRIKTLYLTRIREQSRRPRPAPRTPPRTHCARRVASASWGKTKN
jgi:hypothetical protein